MHLGVGASQFQMFKHRCENIKGRSCHLLNFLQHIYQRAIFHKGKIDECMHGYGCGSGTARSVLFSIFQSHLEDPTLENQLELEVLFHFPDSHRKLACSSAFISIVTITVLTCKYPESLEKGKGTPIYLGIQNPDMCLCCEDIEGQPTLLLKVSDEAK